MAILKDLPTTEHQVTRHATRHANALTRLVQERALRAPRAPRAPPGGPTSKEI